MNTRYPDGSGGDVRFDPEEDPMSKQILMVAALLLVPAGAFASDFRTVSIGGSPARDAQVNIREMDNRVAEPPYALTGKRDRQEKRADVNFNWQPGAANYRPGK